MTEREWVNDIHCGDARETLAEMPESSVHMVMCSPPYYGLRDYGDIESVWGGEDDCDHDWSTERLPAQGGSNTEENPPDVGGNAHAQETRIRGEGVESDRCRDCGAWRGQLGLEPSLSQYVRNLVEIGAHIKRVLRPDGSWWLNLGDSYAGSGGAGGQWTDESSGSAEYAGDRGEGYNGPLNQQPFRRKQKMLVPHRVAIALQEAGWVVRNDVTWVKPNPMPSSVKDRLNTTTEQVFHLTPEPDYWYDLDAIREPHQSTKSSMSREKYAEDADQRVPGHNNHAKGADDAMNPHPAGKNPGDVFEVTTKPFPEAHFAVYPPELCEKPIKATAPPKVCVECGAPYERETEHTTVRERFAEKQRETNRKQVEEVNDGDLSFSNSHGAPQGPQIEHKGWRQTCDCDTDATEPGIVCDPFAGAGTTCLVAKRLGRRFVGVDLNPEYVAMAQKRVGVTVDEPERLLAEDETALSAFTDGGDT